MRKKAVLRLAAVVAASFAMTSCELALHVMDAFTAPWSVYVSGWIPDGGPEGAGERISRVKYSRADTESAAANDAILQFLRIYPNATEIHTRVRVNRSAQ